MCNLSSPPPASLRRPETEVVHSAAHFIATAVGGGVADAEGGVGGRWHIPDGLYPCVDAVMGEMGSQLLEVRDDESDTESNRSRNRIGVGIESESKMCSCA